MSEPERIPADPRVALAAWRVPSARVEGVFYDVALLVGEEDGPARAFWDCTCPAGVYRSACRHIERAKLLLVYELRENMRQADLDARLGCRHPLTVEEDGKRACVGCGLAYDLAEREAERARLQEAIRERHRLPPSPYTGAERSEDPS